MVAQPERHFPRLLERLEIALVDGEGDWPPRRIALAVVAAVAEALPARFRRRADPARWEGLLTRATREAESFSTRRFALTALSHLRRATPAVAEALRAALRDVGRVQEDALAAAERFRLAEGDLVAALAEGLYDESAAAAYATARLLAGLGRARESTAEQRQAILRALAAALRDPRARRHVYVLERGEIKHLGWLDEALYQALVQVVGAGG
ncbi:MAG: hypothetical protein Q9O62_08440 [Ardenticatenia bacterium]|nr:hypothetical protein [Ardenticatenia bacterium]